MIIIALAAGIIGTIASWALRRNTDRSRSWETTGGILDERFVYLTLPGFSLLMFGLGGFGLVQPMADLGGIAGFVGILLLVITGIFTVVGIGISGLGLFASSTPTWALPGWKKKGN